MDGVAVIRALLVADAALLQLVPATRIAAGPLALGTELDAIAITRVSAIDRNIIAPGVTRHVMERVQVSVASATYPGLRAALAAVKGAAADKIGAIAGLADVTVHTDAAGPDFMDDQASIHFGSQDFMIGYTETR